MPNGIDGWITDKVSDSIDAVREATEREAYEDRKRKSEAEDSIKGADYPVDKYNTGKAKEARDDVSQADIAYNAYIAEQGGNTRNVLKSIEDMQMEDFLERVRTGTTYYKGADEAARLGLGNTFGLGYDIINKIDIVMPSDLGSALWAIAPVLMMMVSAIEVIPKLLTIDEETFVEDTIKALALQDKVKERLGEVVK